MPGPAPNPAARASRALSLPAMYLHVWKRKGKAQGRKQRPRTAKVQMTVALKRVACLTANSSIMQLNQRRVALYPKKGRQRMIAVLRGSPDRQQARIIKRAEATLCVHAMCPRRAEERTHPSRPNTPSPPPPPPLPPALPPPEDCLAWVRTTGSASSLADAGGTCKDHEIYLSVALQGDLLCSGKHPRYHRKSATTHEKRRDHGHEYVHMHSATMRRAYLGQERFEGVAETGVWRLRSARLSRHRQPHCLGLSL